MAFGLVVGIAFAVPFSMATGDVDNAAQRETAQGYHKPPALIEAGRDVVLTYDLVCGWDDVLEGRTGTEWCQPSGTLFAKSGLSQDFQAFQLIAQRAGTPGLEARIPASFIKGSVDYYAELVDHVSGDIVRVPSGSSFHTVWEYDDSLPLHLGVPTGSVDPDSILVSGVWGSDSDSFGLAGGGGADWIGPSAFDFRPDGSAMILDRVNSRLVVVSADGFSRELISLDHSGGEGDISISSTGEMYILDQGAGRTAQVDLVDSSGMKIASSSLAGVVPEGLMAEGGRLIVLDGITNFWAKAFDSDVTPVSGLAQLEPVTIGRDLTQAERDSIAQGFSPGELVASKLVVSVTAELAQLALVIDNQPRSVWRITSDRKIGELQLAEIHGGQLIVVLRTWSETSDAFEVLVFSGRELTNHMTVDSADFADSAVLGRFEVEGNALYQLRSSKEGFSIARFVLPSIAPAQRGTQS